MNRDRIKDIMIRFTRREKIITFDNQTPSNSNSMASTSKGRQAGWNQ